MNTEATRYFKAIEKGIGEETTGQIYGLVKEVSKETANLIISKKMEQFVTNETFITAINEIKLAIADLKTEFKLEMAELRTELKLEVSDLKAETKHDGNVNLRWTILLWMGQLGALAMLIKHMIS